MLRPDHHVDSALQHALETIQEIVGQGRDVEGSTTKFLTSLRLLMGQIATSSQITPEQRVQIHQLLTLLETPSPTTRTHSRQAAPPPPQDDKQEVGRGLAYALVNVRDINMICQEYGKVYAFIEGETRRRKINRARRRQGVLEVRTVAHDEWIGPVAWMEWLGGMDMPVRYQAHDIR
jgi:hypothetical protein